MSRGDNRPLSYFSIRKGAVCGLLNNAASSMISENGAQLEYHGSNRETSNPSAHPPLTTTSIAPSPAETRGSWPVSGVQGFTTYYKRVPDYARSSARPRGFAESRASLRGARASSPRAGSRRSASRCTSFERARHDGRHGQSGRPRSDGGGAHRSLGRNMTGGGGPPGRKLPRLDNPCVDFKRVLRGYVWSGRPGSASSVKA